MNYILEYIINVVAILKSTILYGGQILQMASGSCGLSNNTLMFPESYSWCQI